MPYSFIEKNTNIDNYSELHSEMKPEELNFIIQLLNIYSPQKILEVGCAAGGTSATILMNSDANLFSVDISECYYRDKTKKTCFVVDNICSKTQQKRHFTFFGEDIIKNISTIGDDIDFVILDTTHTLPGELLNFICILPFLKNGCLVVLHDIHLNTFPFNEKSITYRKAAYCTKLLLSTVSSNYKYMIKTSMSNIAAFEVDNSTHTHIEDVFLSLSCTWHYFQRDIIDLYKPFVKKYYNNFCYELFLETINFNQKIILKKYS